MGSAGKALVPVLATISLAFSIALLFLSGSCLDWYRSAFYKVDIQYSIYNATTPKNGIEVRSSMLYYAPGLKLVDIKVMLATGVIGAAVAIAVDIISVVQWKNHAESTDSRQAKKRHLPRLIPSGTLLVLSIAAIGVSWQNYVRAAKYIPTEYIPREEPFWYQYDEPYTFETWNYALEVIIAPNPSYSSPTRHEVARWSARARYARFLTVPLAVVALALVVVQLARWLNERQARKEAMRAKLGEVEYVGDVNLELQDRSDVESVTPMRPPPGYVRSESGLPTYAEEDVQRGARDAHV